MWSRSTSRRSPRPTTTGADCAPNNRAEWRRNAGLRFTKIVVNIDVISEDNARHNTEELPYDAPAPAWLPYTRTGDRGATHLGDHSRAGKSEPRVAAYGACGEASAELGLTVTLGTGLTSEMVMLLTRVQNDLVDVSADVGEIGRAHV